MYIWIVVHKNKMICVVMVANEFSLNDFLCIQKIQWFMTKSKSSMVTRDILYLAIDTFLDVVIKKKCPLPSVGWYLFWVVTRNRCLPRHSNKNALYITTIGNVFVARWVIHLVTIPLLDFVMVYWTPWKFGEIHSFNNYVYRSMTEQRDVHTESCHFSLFHFSWLLL